MNVLQIIYYWVHIAYWLAVGTFLIFLPWQDFWENNYFVYKYPSMRSWMANPYLKCAILSLGIANLIIGLQEFAFLRKNQRDSLFH